MQGAKGNVRDLLFAPCLLPFAFCPLLFAL